MYTSNAANSAWSSRICSGVLGPVVVSITPPHRGGLHAWHATVSSNACHSMRALARAVPLHARVVSPGGHPPGHRVTAKISLLTAPWLLHRYLIVFPEQSTMVQEVQ